MAKNNASNIAKGGILTAIGVICVYGSNFFPINKAFILIIASALIPMAVVSTNILTSIMVYLATTLLSILISGLNIAVLAYALFFGIYGICKYFIEKIRRLPFEIIIKFVFFNLSLLIFSLIIKSFFIGSIKLKYPIYILIILCEVSFWIYDYALTIFISYLSKYKKILT
ncbi:MAG: hypothetical protein K0R54_1895 [Clostridiaceae bacterium]|jgi:hypothetical protein|nr:hypothetical protein [Clostridiaceae bacterium]